MPPVGGIARIAAAFEDGQKRLLVIEVPDVPEVRAQYETSKRNLSAETASLRDMEAGLVAEGQTSFAQAYASFSQAYNQAGDTHRAIESIMAKYKITDAEVDYHFKGK